MGRLNRRSFPTLLAFREAQRPPLSQTEAAALVAVTQAHWSRIENGASGASPKVARRIAHITGVPFESLLNLGDAESGVNAGTRSKAKA